jgi:general secretion pathway protein L
VLPLPPMHFEGAIPEQQPALVGYEKAISLALSLTGGARDLNLRRGALAYQHSYAFVKTKLPAVAALVALIVVSFVFSVWAKSESLARDNETLAAELGVLSERMLGERLESPEDVLDTLDRGASQLDKDPQIEMDAFDVMIEVSKAIEDDIVHDIDEFDVQSGKVKLTGIVGATEEAERISAALGKHRCFKDVKISKITQVVNSKRQKYNLSFDVSCDPEKKTLAKTSRGEP